MSGAKENTVAAVVVDEPAPTVVVDEAALLAAGKTKNISSITKNILKVFLKRYQGVLGSCE